eukprot:3859943-Prymnesium_polylepis.1
MMCAPLRARRLRVAPHALRLTSPRLRPNALCSASPSPSRGHAAPLYERAPARACPPPDGRQLRVAAADARPCGGNPPSLQRLVVPARASHAHPRAAIAPLGRRRTRAAAIAPLGAAPAAPPPAAAARTRASPPPDALTRLSPPAAL